MTEGVALYDMSLLQESILCTQDIDAHIADYFFIKDFEIIDNFVVFCGYYSYGVGVQTGIIGWFDIDSLFYYGVSPTIDHSLFTLGMETLDNIEVFRDPSGQMHIAGYGEMTSPPGGSGNYYRVFEAKGNLPGYFNYRTTDLWRYGVHSRITDMAVTDNFVVFLGWDKNTMGEGVGITLHPFLKFNMITSNIIESYYFDLHTYNNPLLPSNADEPITAPKITHSTGDRVAVCSSRQENVTGTTYYLSHWIFDITPCLSGLPVQMLSSATAQIPDYISSTDVLLFDDGSKNFIVLFSHGLGGGITEYAVTTIDFSTGSIPSYILSDYQTAYSTNNYWIPKSICLDVSPQYTVSGFKKFTYEQILWQNIINTEDGSCSNSVPYPLLPQSLFSPVTNIFKADLMGWNKIVFGHTEHVGLDYFPCISICPDNYYKNKK